MNELTCMVFKKDKIKYGIYDGLRWIEDMKEEKDMAE